MSRWFVVLLTIVLCCVGCDTAEEQRDFEEQARQPPDGITRTTDQGEIQAEDEDDWRTAPRYATTIIVDPAFPNPTDGEVNVPLSVREFDAVAGLLEIGSFDETGRFRRLDLIEDASAPGTYVFIFNPLVLGRSGLVRVFILDAAGDIVSYGDLQIEG
jgi:hypothetical protein